MFFGLSPEANRFRAWSKEPLKVSIQETSYREKDRKSLFLVGTWPSSCRRPCGFGGWSKQPPKDCTIARQTVANGMSYDLVESKDQKAQKGLRDSSWPSPALPDRVA